MTTKNKYLIFFTSLVIIVAVTSAVFWEFARQEVYYLCGNFSSGEKKSGVIRQLNTANLSEYSQSVTESGSKITFSSKLNFHIYQCTIELDKNNKVVSATYT
ncbi:hypothetical protein JQC92_07380 [Shewanella sp. 202IG2-18]|uniref:hypothetical protein n=1 Tax=Parashewanella hymeniacidonis TaxID=2807618 RepID=UPI0019616CF3|nr:hypothetical protein [Parashewanella hymeniacidonis]MBM7071863.1 hypothetical protein [Parashewanella hymeniacidonis]